MGDEKPLQEQLGAVTAAFQQYLDSLQALFSVPRKLKDGTPVTRFSDAELALVARFLRDSVKPSNRTHFREYYEFPPGANAYVVSLLGWRPYLEGIAAEAQRRLIFAAPSTAAATLSTISLSVLAPMEIISWGDLAKVRQAKPELLTNAVIIGDLDMPEDKSVVRMMSGDGMISQEQVIKAVMEVARDGRASMVLFHRSGWISPFDLQNITPALASAPGAKGGGCFVATACYGSPDHPAVGTLRRFRDEELTRTAVGRGLVRAYESTSPPLALWLSRHPRLRKLARDYIVEPMARRLTRVGH